MEVSLLSKRGVPDDAIISIRSGSVRRQGAVSADKPFRFPQNVSDSDCVVKVDIMQTIGSGYVVMRPNQTEGKQYEVIMSDNADMACEIGVTPTIGDSPSAGGEDAAAAAKSKQDAKAYLETTGLLPFVQGVLQVVAKQRPDDPFAAMAKHFLSASDEAVSSKPGSPKAAPASPKAVEETPAPASPKAEASAEEPGQEARQTEQAAAEDVGKAESDHVDDHKSDTLEEFTSTVKSGAMTADNGGAAAETSAAAEAGADGEAKAAGEDAAQVVAEKEEVLEVLAIADPPEGAVQGELVEDMEVAVRMPMPSSKAKDEEELIVIAEKLPEEVAAAEECGAA